MRIDVKKFLFIGLARDKTAFFKEAQALGMIQFSEGKKIQKPDVLLFTDAIKVLRALPVIEQKEGVEGLEVAKQILELKHAKEALEETMRCVHLDLERIRIFGIFSLNDVQYIEQKGNRVIQFFCSKTHEEHSHLIYIASEHGLKYYISIQSEVSSYPGMIEIKIDQSFQDLKDQLHALERQTHELEHELKEFAAYNSLLHANLLASIDQSNLEDAAHEASEILDSSLFCATGWVPEDKIESLAEMNLCFAEPTEPEPDETVPTYLENENLGRIGEDLISIYDTPSTQDKDPSLWVLFAFIIFFSIIIGDGGYGSVFLGLALYMRYKFPDLTGIKKRLLNLSTYLAAGCLIWGILSSSFFGMQVGPENPVRAFSLTHYLAEKKTAYHYDKDDNVYKSWVLKYPAIHGEVHPCEILKKGYVETAGGECTHELLSTLTDEVLLELSLFIGVLHLIIGLLRYIKKNWSNIGWVLFLIGSYLYIPVFLGAPSLLNFVFGVPFFAGGEVGLNMIYTGIASAVGIAVFRNGLLGLAEIMNLIQVFADALSYLRLYALGLSGSILSATINSIASHTPFFIAIVLILLGHVINMVLGLMGGVIHGLRLNFLEWYHYSFEGGGRQFKPLELKNKE